jgi:hypothetical protein
MVMVMADADADARHKTCFILGCLSMGGILTCHFVIVEPTQANGGGNEGQMIGTVRQKYLSGDVKGQLSV